MAHYLDPKNDLTFKRVFGEHIHLCMSLLNSMMPFDEAHRIVSLEYLPAELTPEIPEKRNSIVDVRCIDNTGRQFLVEMQMFWTDSFTSRVLFNASKAYIRQLRKGQEYKLLQPVYALGFVNEIYAPSSSDYYHHYQVVNIKDTEEQIKGLEFVFIELPKFKPGNRVEKKLHELWMRFLTEVRENTRTVPEELVQNAETGEALRYLEEGAYSEAELYTYDRYWDAISVERTIHADAIAEGHAEGHAEGRTEGIEIGMEIGRAEAEAEKNMLKAALEHEKAEREALEAEMAQLKRLHAKE